MNLSIKTFIEWSIRLLALYVLLILAFRYESSFRYAIRYLYQNLLEHKIIFHHPKKYLHFPSGEFMFTVLGFCVGMFLMLKKKSLKSIIIYILLSVAIFVISVLSYSYIDGQLRLLQCTNCKDILLKLKYDDIQYDTIFIVGVICAISPILIKSLKQIIKTKK